MKLRRSFTALAPLLVALTLPSAARANGRMPGANDIAVDRGDPLHIVARATFGLVQSFDGGQTWQWICEQAIDAAGRIADPPLAIVGDGSLVVLPPTGSALVSRDLGCGWSAAPAPLEGRRGVDLTLDPSDPAHLYVLLSTIVDIDDQGFGVFENLLVETRDSAQTWSVLATLASDFEAETVEVAASDPERIYVSGTASVNPRLGVLWRSEDGGENWLQTSLELPPGRGSLFISAIDPNVADRLWVRVPARGDTLGILPASLLVSSDKGQSWTMLAATDKAMFGFALSPDGSELAYGGPGDGLFVGASDGSGGFTKVSDAGIRCLRWLSDGSLFACGTEPSDAWSVARSLDQGAAFEPLYSMIDTCPQACADGTSFALSCEESWSTIRPFISASGAMCEVPWARPPSADAGASAVPDGGVAIVDAGESGDGGEANAPDAAGVAPDAGTAPARASGCSCRIVSRAPGTPSWPGLGVLIGALFARWRRRAGRIGGAALAALVACQACGEEQTDPDDSEADAAVFSGCPADIPEFALGMQAAGSEGRMRATVLDAMPAPPMRYLNAWTVAFADAQGAPLADAEITLARPFMPVHGHDGNVAPNVQKLAEPGTFRIERLNLSMRGPWEIQLHVDSASVGSDYVVFHVCIDQ